MIKYKSTPNKETSEIETVKSIFGNRIKSVAGIDGKIVELILSDTMTLSEKTQLETATGRSWSTD